MTSFDVAFGTLVLPDARSGSSPAPGILLLPDVWGLGDLYREFAARLAREGFATLAFDPYGAPVQISDPGRFLRERSDVESLARIRSALQFLRAHPSVIGARTGVLGFCVGGTQALLAACESDDLSACVSCYGILSYEHGLLHEPAGRDRLRKPRDPLEAIDDLRCPLLGLFGDQDEFVPLDDVRGLEEGARRTDRRTEIKIYPGAGHAFLNEARPAAFRPEAARDAWATMLAFLREELSALARR